MSEIVFVLSENNLREGGRERDPLETNLSVNNEKAAYLGDEAFTCLTDDGGVFEARISGDHLKNFRPRGDEYRELGRWLKGRCRALPGDEVHAWWQEAPTHGRVLQMRYVRRHVPVDPEGTTPEQRRLERETEESWCERLMDAGVLVQRQVRVPSGVIDVLTPEAIHEVKTFLTRDDMLKGVGQLFAYRAESDGGDGLRLVLVGRETRETAPLIPTLAKLGVEVQLWLE